MKPKNFSTDKGKYSVVATFTNRNEVTHEEPEKKQRRLPFNQLGKRLRRKKAGSD